MTLQEALKAGERKLEQHEVPEARLNAWYLFAASFHLTKSEFFLRAEKSAEEEPYRQYLQWLEKRCQRIPLEYITGETEFMGLPFIVNEHVLIPRQDTECLTEEALHYAAGADVLDLCTGSGCIGISLAKQGQCKSVTLSDFSAEALSVAAENAERNGVSVEIVKSDLFQQLKGEFDLIVSNPPYIPRAEIPLLMPEVSKYEPVCALDGSEDGLLFYRRITRDARSFLREGGRLLFEIGAGQGEDVMQLMRQAGFSDVEVKQDLAGLDRIVSGQYKK